MENTIKSERKKRKLTQKQLANSVNISSRTLSTYEKGNTPSLSVAHRIAKFFGVDLYSLFKLSK